MIMPPKWWPSWKIPRIYCHCSIFGWWVKHLTDAQKGLVWSGFWVASQKVIFLTFVGPRRTTFLMFQPFESDAYTYIFRDGLYGWSRSRHCSMSMSSSTDKLRLDVFQAKLFLFFAKSRVETESNSWMYPMHLSILWKYTTMRMYNIDL